MILESFVLHVHEMLQDHGMAGAGGPPAAGTKDVGPPGHDNGPCCHIRVPGHH
jgi:hypothetical protein